MTAGGRDPPDLVAAILGEPQLAVRPRRDAIWVAVALGIGIRGSPGEGGSEGGRSREPTEMTAHARAGAEKRRQLVALLRSFDRSPISMLPLSARGGTPVNAIQPYYLAAIAFAS